MNRFEQYRAGEAHMRAAITCGRPLKETLSELLKGDFGDSLFAYAGGMVCLASCVEAIRVAGLLPPPEDSESSQFLHSGGDYQYFVCSSTFKPDSEIDPVPLAIAMVDCIRPHRSEITFEGRYARLSA